MRTLLRFSSLFLVIAAACAPNGPDRAAVSPASAGVNSTPEIECESVLTVAEQDRLLLRRSVTHDRSCADGACFADTCTYQATPWDLGVRVTFDCREGTGP